MKLQHFLIIILLLGSKILWTQIAINTDGSTPDPSAMLDVSSTIKGLLLPRMTSSQQQTITSPDEGLIIYNTDINMWQFYNGTDWKNFDGTSCVLSQPGNISGNILPPPNATGEIYSIASITGATYYTWSVPSGASITSGQGTTSIIVNFGTTSGNISVFTSNACGNSATTELAITLFACGDVFTDDRDSKTYNTVSINGQCWFAENLNTGSMINGSTNQTDNGSIEKYCFDNTTTNCDTYGGLYQWNEMMEYVTTEGAQGICPDGWHVPTVAEWTSLTNYAGGLSVAGGKLKETGTTHWLTPNAGATNEYGFTNLPAGYHNSDGNFHYQTSFSYIWSSTTQTSTSNAFCHRAAFNAANANHWAYSKDWGFSVRCIKN